MKDVCTRSQASCEAHRELYTTLLERYQEQGNYLAKTLGRANKSFKNPRNSFSYIEKTEIGVCLKNAQALAQGIITRTKEETINLQSLLKNIELIFEEKIRRQHLTLKILCPESLVIHDDALFIQFVFINLLGKFIYCVPKNEEISVIVTKKEETGTIAVEIQGKGYSLNNTRENLILKSFHLFARASLFQKICQDNGLIYKASKLKQGTKSAIKVAKLLLPDLQSKGVSANVIQLFQQTS